MPSTLPVLTPAQSNSWDAASAAAGIPTGQLLDAAGRAAANVVVQRFAGACRQGVLVAAGPGNNGGDGWVLARALHAVGIPCWVAAIEGNLSELNRAAAEHARGAGVREVAPDGPWPAAGVLVDALLGTGARGAPRDPVRAVMARMSDLDRPIVALDGPTGLDLGDGVSHEALPATLTISFGGYRRGHLLSRDECGDLVVVDIGLIRPDPSWPVLATLDTVVPLVRPLGVDAHKGSRGRVVVVGGSPGMTGAARLAARAAFGAGAGLVHVLAPAESCAILAAAEPDVQTTAHEFGTALGTAAAALLARADAVLIGPGMGRLPGYGEFVLDVIARAGRVVLDADALMALQGRVDELAMGCQDRPVVLTPHLGEFRALFPGESAMAAVDPWGAAETAATTVGATVLLKGVPTVVASPGHSVTTVAAGNPGLATGGSGDCLAGIAATLLAQGMAPHDVGMVAAHALGGAADLAARRAGARSLRPMDVVTSLPDLWREWDRRHTARPTARPPVLHELPLPRRI